MENSAHLDETRDPLLIAEDWMSDGRDVAVATVVETWGSAPRPVGSHLVIDADGNFHGSVSGGCVEGAVVTEAVDVIDSGKPKMLEFGVADETAWRVGLSCGGRIKVYVERSGLTWMDLQLAQRRSMPSAARAAPRSCVTDLGDGSGRIVREGDDGRRRARRGGREGVSHRQVRRGRGRRAELLPQRRTCRRRAWW